MSYQSQGYPYNCISLLKFLLNKNLIILFLLFLPLDYTNNNPSYSSNLGSFSNKRSIIISFKEFILINRKFYS
jgi:hypothetical protein